LGVVTRCHVPVCVDWTGSTGFRRVHPYQRFGQDRHTFDPTMRAQMSTQLYDKLRPTSTVEACRTRVGQSSNLRSNFFGCPAVVPVERMVPAGGAVRGSSSTSTSSHRQGGGSPCAPTPLNINHPLRRPFRRPGAFNANDRWLCACTACPKVRVNTFIARPFPPDNSASS